MDKEDGIYYDPTYTGAYMKLIPHHYNLRYKHVRYLLTGGYYMLLEYWGGYNDIKVVY